MSFGFSHRFTVDAFGRQIQPSSAWTMAAAARAYHAHDSAEAERCCLALVRQDQRHFDALHLLGVLCLDQSRLNDAVGYFNRAIRERPDVPHVHYHLGTALLELKLYEQAEVALRRALLLRPGDQSTLTNLGNALAGRGRYAEAIPCYHQVLAADDSHAPAHFNLGRSLAALDRLDEAVASFRAALMHVAADTDQDRVADVQANLGQTLVGLGRFDEALALAQSPITGRGSRCGTKASFCSCSAATEEGGKSTKADGVLPITTRCGPTRAFRNLPR